MKKSDIICILIGIFSTLMLSGSHINIALGGGMGIGLGTFFFGVFLKLLR